MPPDAPDPGRPDPKPVRSREWAALLTVVLVATGLRVWKLDQNGTGNPYYGACVRSMLASGTNFFFASFDPLGVVTVDKPPVALWVQASSARLFGYGGLSVLLPQALMGVISVVLTYGLVRRAFGASSGLIAGLALAVTPICVAIDRDNLPDTALVLVLLLATWALTVASESGRFRPLAGSMALIGLAFNIKMLAAFVVLPTFALAYWLAAPEGWRTRLARLSASGLVLVAVSLSWPIAVELTPKARRPFIGGSMNNSALTLALGYNGIARIMGMGGMGPGGQRPGSTIDTSKNNDSFKGDDAAPSLPPMPPGGPPFGPGGMPGFGGTPGFARFANDGIAGLITWLFPLAIVGSAVVAGRSKIARPIGREHLALGIWGGWFLTHWFVFSFARGIFHEYYTTVMGPAVAAMAGIGAVGLWQASCRGGWRAWLFPTAILLTIAWQASIVNHYPEWRRWLLPTLGGGTLVGSIGLLASGLRGELGRSRAAGLASATVGLATLFVGPTLWSFGPVLAAGNSLLPTADPSMFGVARDKPASMMGPGPGMISDPAETRKLVDFLVANRRGESILVAGLSSMEIAPILIETGEPAVAIGGFMGMDRSLSKEQFVKMVEEGRLRFFLIGGGPGAGGPPGFGPGGPPGGPAGFGPGGPPGFPPGGPGGPMGMMGNFEIVEWVREHGEAVDPRLWKVEAPAEEPEKPPGDEPFDPARMFDRMRKRAKLYDCRPGIGLVPAPAR